MARIYVSSTFKDLKDCRDQVIHLLRRMRHEVVVMEDYTAEEQWPADKCLADVTACDLYVGIFAFGLALDDLRRTREVYLSWRSRRFGSADGFGPDFPA